MSNGLQPLTDTSQDLNGDGISLLFSYALDLDPAVDNSGNMPQVTLEGGEAKISYYADADRIFYQAQTSTDLVNWTTAGVSVTGPATLKEAAISTTGDQGFLRLRIEQVTAD